MRFQEKWSVRRSQWFVFAISGLVAACSSAARPTETAVDPSDPLARMVEQGMLPLANTVTLTGNTLAVSVRGGETALISMRPADKAILVNGQITLDSKGFPAGSSTGTAVKKIVVSEDSGHTGAKQILVDYTNGAFATGAAAASGTCPTAASAATAGVWIDAGSDNTKVNTLGIKGSTAADKITFGANGVNMTANKCADLSWQGAAAAMGGVSTFIVSMGAGNDTWYAGGDTATGGVFDNSSPYSSSGAKGVTVYGGAGNDTFLQGDSSHVAKYETMYGGGQSGDTVDYSARSATVMVTVGAGTQDDGDYASGATTEHDDIQNDILVVNGGAGADVMIACPSLGGVDYPITFNGNAGNDTLTPAGGAYIMNGGAGNDTFDMGDDQDALAAPIVHGAGSLLGGAGTDTVDFHARSLYGVTVNLNASYTLSSGVVTWAAGSPTSGTAQATGSATTPGSTVTEGVRVGNDVESVLGTDYADTLTGNALDNKLTGNQGNDTMSGGAGDDTFDESISTYLTALASASAPTDSGADTIAGGAGTDTVDYHTRLAAEGGVWVALDGVAHSGTFDVAGAAAPTQTFGTAGATPPYSDEACPAPSSGGEGDLIGKDVENALGGAGNDCLLGQPAGDTYCATASCANQLSGGDGDDMLFGFDDDDVLEGGDPASGSYSSEANAIDCGGGQGNVSTNKGGGGTAYQLTCQFAF